MINNIRKCQSDENRIKRRPLIHFIHVFTTLSFPFSVVNTMTRLVKNLFVGKIIFLKWLNCLILSHLPLSKALEQINGTENFRGTRWNLKTAIAKSCERFIKSRPLKLTCVWNTINAEKTKKKTDDLNLRPKTSFHRESFCATEVFFVKKEKKLNTDIERLMPRYAYIWIFYKLLKYFWSI